MLRVTLYSGALEDIAPGKLLATLDIGYRKLEALADYTVTLNARGNGASDVETLVGYPRWSGSLWDLVARSLTRALYGANDAPAAPVPDKRCAYATRMCAVIEKTTNTQRAVKLATAEIAQSGKQRGVYTATFTEDVLGTKTAEFAYGQKVLNHSDLLLRAICYAYFGKDTLGARPSLYIPGTITINKVEVFDAYSLPEPVRTGFLRHRGMETAGAEQASQMVKLDDYAFFLMRG